MTEAPFISGERVRLGRALRGWTQAGLRAAMDQPISVPALSQIESGKLRASDATVKSIATALALPVGYFAPRPSPTPAPYFRDLRRTPAAERNRAAALCSLLVDLVAALESRVRLPDLRLPDYPTSPSASQEEVEEAADALRGEWALGEGPLAHVILEIERRGVPVARMSFGHTAIDGFAAWPGKRPLIFLSDDKSSYTRSRFDAAHELGHLVMHRDTTPGGREIERQAHQFASCLLFPRDAAWERLPRRLDSQGWLRLATLKQTWGISMSAMLLRARDMRIITPDAYVSAMKVMSMKGWRTNEPGDRELGLPEASRLLDRALRQMEVETGVTPEQLIEEAALPLPDTLALARQIVDQRPVVEL